MEYTGVEQFTFDCPTVPLLHLGYKSKTDGRVYWAFQYLQQELSRRGRTEKGYLMVKQAKKFLSDVPFIDVAGDVVEKPPLDSRGKVPHHLMTTAAAVTIVATYFSANQTKKDVKAACKEWMAGMCDLAVAVAKKKLDHNMALQAPAKLTPQGDITGCVGSVLQVTALVVL
jgi:hypothetical protein